MGPACHVRLVVAAAQAGRDQRRNRGSLSVSRTRSPQSIRIGAKPAGGCGCGRPVVWATAIIRWLRSWGDLIQPGPDPRIGPLAGHAGTGAPIRYCLPATQATGLLPCCLCTNMWITCAQRRRACAYAVEMLGIPLPGRNHDRAFTWESATRILCIQRKPELSTCQPAIDKK